MAKKNKLALFELLNKSTVKLPPWAYNKNKSTRQETPPPPQNSSFDPKKPFAPSTKLARPLNEKPPRKPITGYINDFLVAVNRSKRHLSYKALAIVVGGILLAIIIIAIFGRTPQDQAPSPSNPSQSATSNSSSPSKTTDNPPLPGEITQVRQSPPKEDIWPDAKFTVDLTNSAKPQSKNPSDKNGPAEAGMCWVLCGNQDKAGLLAVQKYFYDNSLETLVGKFDGRFVLVTRQTFNSLKGQDAINLKKSVEAIGKYYNTNRPAGAPRYDLATFQSAYAVRIDRITLD